MLIGRSLRPEQSGTELSAFRGWVGSNGTARSGMKWIRNEEKRQYGCGEI